MKRDIILLMGKKIWTVDKIREGFDKFLKENGRLPTAPEVDKLEYLPSARQIQRKFGGLEKLRKVLGYSEYHFGRGIYRRQIALRVNKSSLNAERQVELLLIKKFGEPFVHVEKRFGDGKNRLDFFVYSPSGHFGIDVIIPGSFRDLQKNVNLKIDRYLTIPYLTVFVVATDEYAQNKIESWLNNKRKYLPKNCKVFTLEVFKEWLKTLNSYPNPLKIT